MSVRISTAQIPTRVGILIPSLGRANENEVVAAARAIAACLRTAGLDFHDLAECLRSPPEVPQRSSSFADLARAVRDRDCGRLSAKERAFVTDMCKRGFSFRPTPLQSAWLTAIFDRLQGRAAA